MSHSHIPPLLEIESEYAAARAALGYVMHRWDSLDDDPKLLALKLGDMRRARDELERTYLVRVFARLEGLLRDALIDTAPEHQLPHTANGLIDRVGSHWHIDSDTRQEVHRVRKLRNDIAHGRPPGDILTLRDAVRRLCRFVNWIQ